ncbi:MAG: DUF1016 N-terminal domain-containing protein [Odoribacter splanchnicus]|jgi:hypothetical protein
MAQEIDHNLENQLYDDVCNIIEQARYRVAVYVNSEASMMNWNVGKRIKEDVLLNKRADYGEQVLKRLSQRLKAKYGGGWGYQKLQHCVRAAYTFGEDEKRGCLTMLFSPFFVLREYIFSFQ